MSLAQTHGSALAPGRPTFLVPLSVGFGDGGLCFVPLCQVGYSIQEQKFF